MRQANRFGRGGCYTCDICKRKTRATGRLDNENSGLCAECFDAGSIENTMSDQGETPELLAEWQALVDTCKAKGGKPSEDKWWR